MLSDSIGLDCIEAVRAHLQEQGFWACSVTTIQVRTHVDGVRTFPAIAAVKKDRPQHQQDWFTFYLVTDPVAKVRGAAASAVLLPVRDIPYEESDNVVEIPTERIHITW